MLTYGTAKTRCRCMDTDRIELVAFDPTGELLLTGSLIRRRGCGMRDRATAAGADGPRRALTTAVFSPDGRRVLTASTDGLGRLWEVETGELKVTLRGHTEPLEMGAFRRAGIGLSRRVKITRFDLGRSDGRGAALSSWPQRARADGCVCAVGKLGGFGKLRSDGAAVGYFDGDGAADVSRPSSSSKPRGGFIRRTASGHGSWDGTVRLWPDRSGIDAAAKWHRDDARHAAARAAVSPDGGLLASAGPTGWSTCGTGDLASRVVRSTVTLGSSTH